jgi:NADPH:quinone reductase-like Zn-dependent oxidoreductase
LPGLEVSGRIVGLGLGVHDWQIGQPVCALLSGGGYAEYATAPASQLLPIPEAMRLKDAASLPESLATSVMALMQVAQLHAGERVLVHGGTSGLGIIMVQVAKALGAELFATVGSDEKIAFLQPFGVRGINHRTAPFQDQLMQATHGEGVDVIIDTLGAPQLATHFKLLRSGGRMVTLAMLEGNRVESLKIAGFFMKQLRWSAATLRGRTHAQKAEIMAIIRHQLWPHLLSGRIQPVVDSVFPLIDAEIALKKMQERLHMGKILLEVGIGD